MHSRAHNDFFKSVLRLQGDTQIAVVKLRCSSKKGFKGSQPPKRRPPQEYERPLDTVRYQEFTDMEPRGCCHIYFHIGMMGPVKPPEKTDPVVSAVHPVIPKIKDHKGDKDFRPAAQAKDMSQTVGANAGITNGCREDWKKHQIEDQGVEEAYAEVKDNAERLLLTGPCKRIMSLQENHAGKQRKVCDRSGKEGTHRS